MIDFNLFSKTPLTFDIENDNQYRELDIEVNFKTEDFLKTIHTDKIDDLIIAYNHLATPITTIVRSNDIADLAATMLDEFDNDKIVRLMKEIDGLDHEMYVEVINFIYNCAKAKADLATRNTIKRIEYISSGNNNHMIPETEVEGNPDVAIFNDPDECDFYEHNVADTCCDEENIAAESIPSNGDITDEEYEAIRDKLENEGIVP